MPNYNPYYPQIFPQNYPQNYQQNYQQNYPQTNVSQGNNGPQTAQQIQNSGFLPAPNEEYVNTFPIGAGNCITFKIEGKPIVMEKSMGFSQLESPKIKRYRLIEEEEVAEIENTVKNEAVKPAEIEKINNEITALWNEVNGLKNNFKKPINSKKKVEVEDDTE